MSVAEALTLQKASIPVYPKLPPSILHPPKVAAKIPLVEQAAVASNSLTLLSTTDQQFPLFATDLLLSSPTSRHTLDSAAQEAVSSAAIAVSKHLSPIFPTRHAQRVYEWLVNGLHGGLLGSDAEVDALLLSALPFYSTPQFPAFVAAVILPRPRKRWEWLLPVARAEKPPDLSFLVQNCPGNLHRRAVDWALDLASASIPTTYASSFIANVTAKWIFSATGAQRRSVVLVCMKALVSALTLPHGNISELVCALFVVATCGAVSGTDEGVASVVANAAVVTMVRLTDSAAKTAVGCLSIVLNRYGNSCLPIDSAVNFIQKGKAYMFADVGDVAPDVYCAVAERALGESMPSVQRLCAVKEALLGDGASLITPKVVTVIVAKMLDLCSFASSDFDLKNNQVESGAVYDALLGILSPLARGKFAEAVDLGLRMHFDGRNKNDLSRYAFADKVLFSAMNRTPFEIIKSKMDSETADSMVMFAALDHPESSVRRHALEYLLNNFSLVNQHDGLAESLCSKLQSIISIETDLDIVLIACDCAVTFVSSFDSKLLLRQMGFRVLTILDSFSGNERRHERGIQFLKRLSSLCKATCHDNPLMVLSLLVGTALHHYCNDNIEAGNYIRKVLLATVENMREKDQLGNLESLSDVIHSEIVSKVVLQLVESTTFDQFAFLRELREWNSEWCLIVIRKWIELAGQSKVTAETCKMFEASVGCLKEMNFTKLDELLEVVVFACKNYCARLNDDDMESSTFRLWCLTASRIDDIGVKKLVETICSCLGIESTLGLMKRAFCSEESDYLQTVSLRWYMSIVAVHSSESLRQKEMLCLVDMFYGTKLNLRHEVKRFFKNYSGLISPRANSNNCLVDLSEVVLNLPKSNVEVPRPDPIAAVIVSHLQKHILTRIGNRYQLPCSISTSSCDLDKINRIMSPILDSLAEIRILSDTVPLLRAVQGHKLTTNRPMPFIRSLWLLLRQGVVDISVAKRDLHSELIARVVVLLSDAKISTLAPKEVLDSLSIIISHLEVTQTEGCEDVMSVMGLEIVFLAAGTLFLRVINMTTAPALEVRSKLVSILLSASARSSLTSTFARELLDAALGDLLPVKVLQNSLLKMERTLLNNSKKLKTDERSNFDVSLNFSDVMNESVGALKAVRRRCSQTRTVMKSGNEPIGFLKVPLCSFLNAVSTVLENQKANLDEDVEFILRLSLDTLCDIYQILPSEKKTDELLTLNVLINLLFYPGTDCDILNTALAIAIRKSAMHLLEILAPLHSDELNTVAEPVIASLLQSKDLTRASKSLNTLIPCLLKGGNNYETITKWVSKAAFSTDRSQFDNSRLRSIVVSCCGLAPNVKDAVRMTIDSMIAMASKYKSKSDLGNECSLFIHEAGLSPVEALEVISTCTEYIRCDFASNYLPSSAFIAKFFKSMRIASDKKAIMSKYSGMLISLAKCESSSIRKTSMLTALEILPLAGLSTCIEQAITCSTEYRTLVWESLAFRLEDFDSPLTTSWNLEQVLEVDSVDETKKSERAFLEHTGKCLNLSLSSNGQPSVQERRTAVLAASVLMKRFGTANDKTCVQLSSQILGLIGESLVDAEGMDTLANGKRNLLSTALRCLSSVVSTLGNKAVVFIPQLLDAAVSVIERTFGRAVSMEDDIVHNWISRMVPVVEAAVETCTRILECVPKFFGQKSLERLATLVLKNETQVLASLLDIAMEKLPSNSAVSGMLVVSEELEGKNARAAGIAAMITSLQSGVVSMKKSEVKLHAKSLIRICTNCLEYDREKLTFENQQSVYQADCRSTSDMNLKNVLLKDPVLLGYKTVDEKCGDLLTVLALRLPESEFKNIFESLCQWCDHGSISKQGASVCNEVEKKLVNNLVRAVPFYRMIVKLFEKLEAIMVPYFMRRLDNVLYLIAIRNWKKELEIFGKNKRKKRSRKSLKDELIQSVYYRLASMQQELQDVCLQGLTLMLNQSSCVKMLGPTIVSKIQEALLTCFDEYDGKSENVTKALSALCVRIAAMRDSDQSQEESRQLLNTLSKQLLLRTREDAMSLREGALLTSRAIALAVGEDYLVILPETMPVLAEVIDDEEVTVREATQSFASVLETLAGENLIDQLKK